MTVKEKRHFLTEKLVKRVVFGFTFITIAAVYLSGIKFHPRHVDEHEWVRRGLLLTQAHVFDQDFYNNSRLPYYRYYVLVITLGWFVLVGLYVKVNFHRYYYPLVPFLSLIQAFGILWLIDGARAFWGRYSEGLAALANQRK